MFWKNCPEVMTPELRGTVFQWVVQIEEGVWARAPTESIKVSMSNAVLNSRNKTSNTNSGKSKYLCARHSSKALYNSVM